ncbi:MAG: GlxA family transcriptional regulator [Hyphomicrobiaceae bacterium]|nr:GlxA family transcriptional regulator [Hyphomicrobiaceae bacterium]
MSHTHRPEPEIFVFLLVPGVSMMSLASALEPLRSLNLMSGRRAYAWRLASLDGVPVAASNGIDLPTMAIESALDGAAYVFACGGLRVQSTEERRYLAALRTAARRGIAVGSLSTATYLLARAGLLSGYRCTIHWENRAAFEEDFPELNCTSKIYEIDRDRLTCSGGTAAMDMMLHLIAERHGPELARSVANQFHHERIRGEHDDQRGSVLVTLAHLPPKLRKAIEAMQQRLENPVPLPEIAAGVSLSTRQLERLFRQHARMSPLRYYIQMRIERAHELLLYTDKPIIEVAVQVGFASTSHFAAWFKRVLGARPSEIRGGRQAGGPLSVAREHGNLRRNWG